MNKTIVGFLLGLLIGAAAMRLLWPQPDSGEHAKPEASVHPAEKPNPLHLPADRRDAAGITLAKPAAITVAPEVQAFGRVLDPVPFVALVAEMETARAAAAASDKELARVRKLFAAGGNASAQAVEAAEAVAARDRSALASANVRLLATWGRELSGKADFAFVTDALEKGESLARLDVLPGEMPASAPKTARVSPVAGGEAIDADVLGVAPAADPQVQGASFLVLVRGRSLPAGAALRASLPGVGDPRNAFSVPRSAIVYHRGSAWVYVLGEKDTFERKRVEPARITGDTVVLENGVAANDAVVTTGAQQLLAAELQAGGAGEG